MDISALGNIVAEEKDLNENESFERELPPEGKTTARFIEFIEFGTHAPRNPQHKPGPLCALKFELNNPANLREVAGVTYANTITINIKQGKTAASAYKKLFQILNKACGGKHVHFATMLGAPLICEVFHNTTGEGSDKKTYANLDNNGAYSFTAPFYQDPVSGENSQVKVPEARNPLKLFIWECTKYTDEEIQWMWDQLFIEGEREVNGKTESKNWIQEKIKKAIDWEGSRTQSIVEEELDLSELTPAAQTTTEDKVAY